MIHAPECFLESCSFYCNHHTDFVAVSAKSATSDDGVHCWKCGSVVAQTHVLFCGECRVVQKPAPGADYFEILGVEADFDLDVKQLTNKFRLLQMQLHPDRFSTRTEVVLLGSAFREQSFNFLQNSRLPYTRAMIAPRFGDPIYC